MHLTLTHQFFWGKGENHLTLENNLPNELGTNNRATIKRSLLRTERISNNPMAWAGKEDGTSCKELHQSPGCTLYTWCYAKKTVV
jgi:hypothetical protein